MGEQKKGCPASLEINSIFLHIEFCPMKFLDFVVLQLHCWLEHNICTKSNTLEKFRFFLKGHLKAFPGIKKFYLRKGLDREDSRGAEFERTGFL